MTWFGKIGKNYGWEVVLFNKMKRGKGITFCCFDCEWAWDKEWDHHPQFMSSLLILNWMVFEFNIYYLFHRDDEEDTEEVTLADIKD